jgi:hypothetical protein
MEKTTKTNILSQFSHSRNVTIFALLSTIEMLSVTPLVLNEEAQAGGIGLSNSKWWRRTGMYYIWR